MKARRFRTSALLPDWLETLRETGNWSSNRSRQIAPNIGKQGQTGPNRSILLDSVSRLKTNRYNEICDFRWNTTNLEADNDWSISNQHVVASRNQKGTSSRAVPGLSQSSTVRKLVRGDLTNWSDLSGPDHLAVNCLQAPIAPDPGQTSAADPQPTF